MQFDVFLSLYNSLMIHTNFKHQTSHHVIIINMSPLIDKSFIIDIYKVFSI